MVACTHTYPLNGISTHAFVPTYIFRTKSMESFINEAPGLQHTTHEWHILDIIISIFWCIQNKGQFNITKVNIYIISP